MYTSWFKFQLISSNGVGCSEGAYIHIYIHSDSIKTEVPLFYYYNSLFMFISVMLEGKICGFQKKVEYIILRHSFMV